MSGCLCLLTCTWCPFLHACQYVCSNCLVLCSSSTYLSLVVEAKFGALAINSFMAHEQMCVSNQYDYYQSTRNWKGAISRHQGLALLVLLSLFTVFSQYQYISLAAVSCCACLLFKMASRGSSACSAQEESSCTESVSRSLACKSKLAK